jgi:2-iminobutanoate/2-iminopropanoate deaminase
MTTEILPLPSAPQGKGPYSPAVRAGDWIVFSGQIGTDPATGSLVEGGMLAEADRIFATLDALIPEAGASKTDIARVAVFVTDLGEFAPMNEAYAAFFGEHRPARTTVQVAALPAGAHIEIEIWVHKP